MTPLSLLYRALWQIAPPLIRRYLRRRAVKNPAYLDYWDERFGRPHPAPLQNAIWLHAVSVGETRAAEPLVRSLRRRFPDAPLLITQMTPTGRETAEKLFPDAQCRYLPYDRPDYVAQFLDEHRPRFGILMETEIWPHLMAACRERNLPLFLANARLSEKSQRGYLKAASLIRPALAALKGCYVQTETDAGRLKSLGAADPKVCGNTKYDISPPPEQLEKAAGFKRKIGGRPTAVCGSTRFYRDQDEAELLLRAWQSYRGDALLVIVPRHPERFEAVFQTALTLGFRTQKRSDGQEVAADTQVWIGDSMGELAAYYLSADIAFVGGSLVDAGCQNIIEPISCRVPTLFGYSNYNFAQACKGAVEAKAAVRVETAEAWYRTTRQYLDDETLRQQLISHTEQFISQHQGASAKIAKAIADCLNQR